MNSRELAEKIWKTIVQPAYTYAHEESADPEPEDKEAALQALEGILEREAGVKPDLELEKIRKMNGPSYG
jgi:hypothetical protein